MLTDAETIDMIYELVGRANLAMVETLNAAASAIYEGSEKEVPKSEDHRMDRANYPSESLAEGAFIREATPESHVAQVVYQGPYAGAQEAGMMMYEDHAGKTVDWEVEQYTTEGTKSHFLEDAGKAVLGMIGEELGIQGRIAFGDIPGLVTSTSSLQAAGLREENMAPPVGEVEAAMNAEAMKAAEVTTPEIPTFPEL